MRNYPIQGLTVTSLRAFSKKTSIFLSSLTITTGDEGREQKIEGRGAV